MHPRKYCCVSPVFRNCGLVLLQRSELPCVVLFFGNKMCTESYPTHQNLRKYSSENFQVCVLGSVSEVIHIGFKQKDNSDKFWSSTYQSTNFVPVGHADFSFSYLLSRSCLFVFKQRRGGIDFWSCCSSLSKPSTSLWSAWPDGSGWRDNLMAA